MGFLRDNMMSLLTLSMGTFLNRMVGYPQTSLNNMDSLSRKIGLNLKFSHCLTLNVIRTHKHMVLGYCMQRTWCQNVGNGGVS